MCGIVQKYLENARAPAPPPPPLFPPRSGLLPAGIPPPPSMRKFVSQTSPLDFNGAGTFGYTRGGRDGEFGGIDYMYMGCFGKPLLLRKWDIRKRNPNWKHGMDDSLKTIVGLTPGVELGNGEIEMDPGSNPTVMGQSSVNPGKYCCQKSVMAFGGNNDNIRSVDASLLKCTLRSIEWSVQLMPKEDVCYGIQLQDLAWTAHHLAWKISMVAHDPRAVCGQFVWHPRATLFDKLLAHGAFKVSLHKDEDGNYSMLEKGEYHNVRKYLKDRFIVPTEG